MIKIDLKKTIKDINYDYENGNLSFKSSLNESLLIEIEEDTSLTIKNDYNNCVTLVVKNPVKLELNILNNGCLNNEAVFFNKDGGLSFNNMTENYGDYHLTLVDLSTNGLNSISKINTLKEGSNSDIFCASLCGEGKKIFSNQIINKAAHTVAYMENYGVAYKKGNLEIEGIGDIKHGSYQSKNRQKSNLVVMDQGALASSKPYLYIDENDVEASHASAVGEISSEQLFYLCSRGLSKEDAKRMIILGCFAPVINRIKDEELRNDVIEEIRGVINNA